MRAAADNKTRSHFCFIGWNIFNIWVRTTLAVAQVKPWRLVERLGDVKLGQIGSSMPVGVTAKA